MLAPVMITTYSRLHHLQRALEALKKNELADETTVYVYLDGPRSGDEEKVDAVRKYLKTVTGFGAFHVVARQQNLGAHENAKQANYEVLDKHGSMIRMEDDIVTAQGFLRFMNLALAKYKDDRNVFSISGYCPPIKIPDDYKNDVFFIRRFNGWGCGLWRDRLDDAYRQITPDEFDKFSANKKLSASFVKGGGKDMLVMLEAVAYGRLDAGDVVGMYNQFIKDQYTLYPTKSLVQNIGFDGSGVHCGATNRFEVILSDKTSFNFPDKVLVDQRIINANLKFRNSLYPKPSYVKRMVSRIRGILGRLRRKCMDYFKSTAVD